MSIQLFPDQIDFEANLRAAMGKHRRICGVAPTGSGKTIVLAHITMLAVEKGKRVVIIAHRAEIVDQICAALDRFDIPYGRMQRGWPHMKYSVTVAMVQTLARRLEYFPEPDLLIVDEAHHAVQGQWAKVAGSWGRARILGLTATPQRTDNKGLGEAFDEMVLGPTVGELIAWGRLANFDYYRPTPEFSMEGVGKSMGDYDTGAALKVMAKSKIVGCAIENYRTLLQSRPAIAFCMGVDHCQDTAAEFRAAGIRSAHIDGKMAMGLRSERLGALANGELDVLTAADVVSEGTDIPAVAGAILLRPTCSLSLFRQQVGRALRRKPDGSRAVIIDHVNNYSRHGLPSDPIKWTLNGGIKESPKIRECETCHRVFAAGTAREIAEQECGREACPMLAPASSSERAPLEIAAGTLEIVKDPWAWARGCDPVRASGAEFRTLLELADTEERLRMISRARGYKRGWVQHQLRLRSEQGIAA